MIASKFGIGQQVRHTLLGYLGVVVDIDPVYSLAEPEEDEIAANDELRASPWYHVVLEDAATPQIYTYLAVKPAMNIRNSRRWTSWPERFADSCRPRGYVTDVKKPRYCGVFYLLRQP